MLIIILTAVVGIFCILELATLLTFGDYLTDFYQQAKVFSKLDEYFLNMYDTNIICHDTCPFISRCGFSFLCKYYIHGIGLVPRWTVLSSEIDRVYKDLQTKHFNKFD